MSLPVHRTLLQRVRKVKFVATTLTVVIALFMSSGIHVLLSQNNRAKADYLGFTPDFVIGDKLTPQGIASTARDAYGNTYISDSRGHIKKVSPSGTFIMNLGRPGDVAGTFSTSSVSGITTDSQGYVYAVDKDRHAVYKFDTSGAFVSSLGTFNAAGSADGQFSSPHWVAVDANDNLYVTDTNNNRIQKFDKNGTFIWKSGTLGAGDGQFNSPKIISVNNDGILYISESGNNRIQKITSDTGAYVGKFTYAELLMGIGCSVGGATGMGFDLNNNLYVSTAGIGCSPVFAFNSLDAHTYSFSVGNFIYGLSVTSDQKLLFAKSTLTIAATQTTNEIYETTLDGSIIKKYGSGLGDGKLRSPGMTVEDSAGNIYVMDTGNFRIQKFDSNGNFMSVISGYGTAAGQISSNTGDLAIDSDDNLYVVARTANGRIDKFSSDGTYLTSFTLGSYPAGSGYVTYPNHIEVTNDGLLHVQKSSTILSYNATTGAFVRSTTTPYSTIDFTTDGTRLYAVGSSRVMVVNDGVIERSFSTSVSASNALDGRGAFNAFSTAVTVDGYGNIYVPGGDGTVGVFSNSGSFIHRFGSYMAAYTLNGGRSRTLYMRVSPQTGAFYYNGDYDFIEVSSSYIVTVPSAPQNVVASSNQPGILNVSWSAPLSDGGSPVHEYTVEVFTPLYGTWSSIATVRSPATNATVNIPAGTYDIRVSARSSAGTGSPSSVVSNTLVGAPYSFTSTINVGDDTHISGIAADGTGTYYATDDYNSRVLVLDSSGATIRTFGESDLSYPSDIAIGPDGNLFVSDEGMDKIFVYSKDGTLLRSFGTPGTGDGQLYSPSKLNFDRDGNLLVVNYWRYQKIQRFDINGNYLGRVAPQITTPQALGVDRDGNLYIGHGYSLITKLTPDGLTEIFQIGGDGAENGQFSEVVNIVINEQNQIIASDPWNYRVQVFNPDGTYNSQFGVYNDTDSFTAMNGDGQLDIDASGNIYVSNTYFAPPSISILAPGFAATPPAGPSSPSTGDDSPSSPAEPSPSNPSGPAGTPVASGSSLSATGMDTITIAAVATALLVLGAISAVIYRRKYKR